MTVLRPAVVRHRVQCFRETPGALPDLLEMRHASPKWSSWHYVFEHPASSYTNAGLRLPLPPLVGGAGHGLGLQSDASCALGPATVGQIGPQFEGFWKGQVLFRREYKPRGQRPIKGKR